MVDPSLMDSHLGQEALLDAVLGKSAIPSSPKMNGSVHHRHNLNMSGISAASSKHSGASNGFVIADPKTDGSLVRLADHIYSCADVQPEHNAIQPQPPSKNLHRLRFYCQQQHVPEVLGSLALLSVVSIILAFIAIIFLLRITPLAQDNSGHMLGTSDKESLLSHTDHAAVYEVVRGLIVCTISMNFTCFLICVVQFTFAAKLLRISHGHERAVHYLHKGACTRKGAICSFFISIPVFLTGLILYAFIQFQTLSALVSAAVLGIGIIFSGIATIHNVYIWQKEQVKCNQQADKTEHCLEPVIVTDDHSPSSTSHSHTPYMELSTLV